MSLEIKWSDDSQKRTVASPDHEGDPPVFPADETDKPRKDSQKDSTAVPSLPLTTRALLHGPFERDTNNEGRLKLTADGQTRFASQFPFHCSYISSFNTHNSSKAFSKGSSFCFSGNSH